MDLDDPHMSSPRPDEGVEEFNARLRMLHRATPVLRQIPDGGFTVIVESDRRADDPTSIRSSLVIEFGDARLRVVLCPGAPKPLDRSGATERFAEYLLAVPDTDAIAVVADDEELTTWVLEAADVGGSLQDVPSHSLRDAVYAYFKDNVLAVEMPDFRSSIELPRRSELERRLMHVLTRNFDKVATSRAVIREKKDALANLGADERDILFAALLRVLDHELPPLEDLTGVRDGRTS